MKTVNVGLLGLGTVGGGTATVLSRNAEEISHRIGCEIKITHAAAKEIEHASDLGLGDKSFTSYGCDLSYEYVKINAEYRT